MKCPVCEFETEDSDEYLLHLVEEKRKMLNQVLNKHECQSYEQWLMSVHYMCSCGHVEWAHYGERLNKGRCAHCNCTQYNGEIRPLTEFEKLNILNPEKHPSLDEFIKTWTE